MSYGCNIHNQTNIHLLKAQSQRDDMSSFSNNARHFMEEMNNMMGMLMKVITGLLKAFGLSSG